jgi:hypothetical protein
VTVGNQENFFYVLPMGRDWVDRCKFLKEFALSVSEILSLDFIEA